MRQSEISPLQLQNKYLQVGVNKLSRRTDLMSCLDARLPIHATQAVFTATQTQNKALPLTQSAAAMVQSSSMRYSTGYAPVDTLLDGGVKRGSVLELSGPPGTSKESVALGMARAFLDDNKDVLFVGRFFERIDTAILR